jgi:hypothetical protein
MNTDVCMLCGHTRLLHDEKCMERVVSLGEILDTWGLSVPSITSDACDCPAFHGEAA